MAEDHKGLSEWHKLHNCREKYIHRGKPYHCHRVFTRFKAYRAHLSTRHGKLAYLCLTCNNSFTCKNEYRAHIITCTEVPLEKGVYDRSKCPLCDLTFTTDSSTYRHIKTKHPEIYNTREEMLQELKHNEVIESQAAEEINHGAFTWLKCVYCLTIFHDKSSLASHSVECALLSACDL